MKSARIREDRREEFLIDGDQKYENFIEKFIHVLLMSSQATDRYYLCQIRKYRALLSQDKDILMKRDRCGYVQNFLSSA